MFCSLVTTTWLLAPSVGSFCKDTLMLSSKGELRTSAWETFPFLKENAEIARYFLETETTKYHYRYLIFTRTPEEEKNRVLETDPNVSWFVFCWRLCSFLQSFSFRTRLRTEEIHPTM